MSDKTTKHTIVDEDTKDESFTCTCGGTYMFDGEMLGESAKEEYFECDTCDTRVTLTYDVTVETWRSHIEYDYSRARESNDLD